MSNNTQTPEPKNMEEAMKMLPILSEPARITLLKSDITVMIDNNEEKTNCDQVTFKLTLVAGLIARFQPAVAINVEVLVYDDCANMELLTIPFRSSGESKVKTVELPATLCRPTGGDWHREFVVIADPFKKFGERNEQNNVARVRVFCLG